MKRFAYILLTIFLFTSLYGKNLSFLEKHFKDNNARYVIYVNKEDKQMLLVNRKLDVVKEYKIATGSGIKDKMYRGDDCTPEGVYTITQIWEENESEKLKDARQNIKLLKKGTDNYKKAKSRIELMEREYKKGTASLKRMNDVNFIASEGHAKWGTKEDLGKKVYGPVFMRLSFPNEQDKAKYEKAIKKGKIPKGANGKYRKQGSGIAIHGTNDPPSIGYNASSGCIRLLNSDVLELRNYSKKGTIVVIE